MQKVLKVTPKLEEFDKTHLEAMALINSFLKMKPSDDYYELATLVRWMLSSEDNPYSYIPSRAYQLYSATGFKNLIQEMHHALYDDGEMSFVLIDNEPIIFMEEHEYDDLVMDITPSEFCKVRDKYSEGEFISHFVHDYARFGDEVIPHYCKSRFWTDTLISENYLKIRECKRKWNLMEI